MRGVVVAGGGTEAGLTWKRGEIDTLVWWGSDRMLGGGGTSDGSSVSSMLGP